MKALLASLALVLFGCEPAPAHQNGEHISSSAKIHLSRQGSGSAIYIGEGRWLTAKHVASNPIKSLRTPTVYYFSVKVEWLCPSCDLAVVQTDEEKGGLVPPMNWLCREPVIGEHVSYSGSPQNSMRVKVLTFYGRVAGGLSPLHDGSWRFPINAYGDVGASGSGLLGEFGNVIGIITQQERRFVLPGIAVPETILWVSPLTEFCAYERDREASP